jgi:hypothetical protein
MEAPETIRVRGPVGIQTLHVATELAPGQRVI